MVKCRKCGCLCDSSDIRDGLCEDCRAEEKEHTEKEPGEKEHEKRE